MGPGAPGTIRAVVLVNRLTGRIDASKSWMRREVLPPPPTALITKGQGWAAWDSLTSEPT